MVELWRTTSNIELQNAEFSDRVQRQSRPSSRGRALIPSSRTVTSIWVSSCPSRALVELQSTKLHGRAPRPSLRTFIAELVRMTSDTELLRVYINMGE